MKLFAKITGIWIASFAILIYAFLLLGNMFSVLIPGGAELFNSYFFPLYCAIVSLSSSLIACTYYIVTKINLLTKKLILLKQEDDLKPLEKSLKGGDAEEDKGTVILS